MLRAGRSAWPTLLVLLLAAPASWSAPAESVLVARPDASDAMLTEAFSRLCGELRMYGFQVQLSDREDGIAEGEGALAGGVSLYRAPGQANARIWIADRATGKRSLGITVSVDDAEAPSLLAMRAADLLRASLRDWERAAEASPERPVPVVVESSAAPAVAPSADRRWAVHGGIGGLWETGELGLGWTAQVGGARWLSSRLALGVEIEAPVSTQDYEVSSARAHLRGALGLATVRWRPWAGHRLSLDLVQGLGAAFLSVKGEAQFPWSGQSTTTWTAASSTGACLDLALSSHAGLTLSLAAVFLLPRPTLDVADVSYTIRQPLLVTSAGVRYTF